MTPTPFHMHHSQNFDKINTFLKPVLNIFIFYILRVQLRRGLSKRELLFCIKSIDTGDVLIFGRRRIHQSKNWYYLGHLRSMFFFAKIFFSCQLLTSFCKKLQLICLTSSIRRFQKTLFIFS